MKKVQSPPISSAELDEFAVYDQRDLGAFCPAALDDWGLSLKQFRVYLHVCRRAGKGACFASQSTIAGHLGLSRKSVNEALRDLVTLGFIDVEKRSGNRRLYRLLPIPPRRSDSCNEKLQQPDSSTGSVTKSYNTTEESEACCNPSVTTVVTLALQPYKVLPDKDTNTSLPGPIQEAEIVSNAPYWEGCTDPIVVYIAEAFHGVTKYAHASRPPTLKRVTDLVARIRQEAPDDQAIIDMVDGWKDFHEADEVGKYGRNDPVASLRERIAFLRPKWAVVKKRARGSSNTRTKSESLQDEVTRLSGGVL